MKQRNNTLLTPAQQRAMDGILGGLRIGDVIVLRAAAGMGRSAVLRRVHEAAGGALVSVREFMQSLAAREPAVIEEAFLNMVEQALAVHYLVIVDDLHLVANAANRFNDARTHLLDAALTGIMADAAAWRKKLVFGVEGKAPWPVRRRACQWEIAAFGVDDFERICRSLLPAEIAGRLDYTQIHRFAPALSARRLTNACDWFVRKHGTETGTAGFIECLRSHDEPRRGDYLAARRVPNQCRAGWHPARPIGR